MTAAGDSATGGADPAEGAALTGAEAVAADLVTVDLVTVDHHVTVTGEVDRETAGVSVEDSRTVEDSQTAEDSQTEETGTLTEARRVVASRPGGDLLETGGLGIPRSSESPHQKSCPSGPG